MDDREILAAAIVHKLHLLIMYRLKTIDQLCSQYDNDQR